jgi:nucleotide-binding universal stress UspA family protein
MDFANILVSVDDGPGTADRVQLAGALARRFGATLTAAAARPKPVPSMHAALQHEDDIRSAEEERLGADLAGIRALIAREAGPLRPTVWRQALASAAEHLIRQARGADLVVVGRRGPADGGGLLSVPPDRVLMEAGRPVLIAPPGIARLAAERILVAWKDTPEARRAVSAALPLCRSAATVLVATVGPDAADEGGADVAEHLARHGARARVRLLHGARGQDESEPLLSLAHREGVDLVVLGAYGRGRLREWAFGGVTRSLLQRAPLCCLMSH